MIEHLDAIRYRLHTEKERLRKSKTEQERKLREVWVMQIEKEEKDEIEFLKLNAQEFTGSDDELLFELFA